MRSLTDRNVYAELKRIRATARYTTVRACLEGSEIVARPYFSERYDGIATLIDGDLTDADLRRKARHIVDVATMAIADGRISPIGARR